VNGDEGIGPVACQVWIEFLQQVSLVAQRLQGVDNSLGDVEVDLDLS